MSTEEEIYEVYSQDILQKSRIVEQKFGKLPFFDGCKDMSVYETYYGMGIDEIVCSEFYPRKKKCPSKKARRNL